MFAAKVEHLLRFGNAARTIHHPFSFSLSFVICDVLPLHDIDCFKNKETILAIYEIIINPAAKKDRREKAGVNLVLSL
jgi:hypothetical protein